MLPTTGINRKSRLEGKPSMLPTRRPNSFDRLSSDARKPTMGRSSSAEPPRGTFKQRLSREASASKIPSMRRSKSQQGPDHGQSLQTPMSSKTSYNRFTSTPSQRTPENRSTRNWENCLERVRGCVTVRDKRPISDPGWQRAEFGRVQAALSMRSPGVTLMRPLTITRFVQITGDLISSLLGTDTQVTNGIDTKITNDNYVLKLPLIAKWLLYPGTISKSWLKTVNTLHAFPHALAFIGYLLDLTLRFETPVLDEEIWASNDEISLLKRKYIRDCWFRFQTPNATFEDLIQEYKEGLSSIFSVLDTEKEELIKNIAQMKDYINDETEKKNIEDQIRAQRQEHLNMRQNQLREQRTQRLKLAADIERLRRENEDADKKIKQLDMELQNDAAEISRLTEELQQQTMSVGERVRLLEEVDYAARVLDSKQALAKQLAKSVQTTENEIAIMQKKTLSKCMEYNQGIINASSELPELQSLLIDENKLMEPECVALASGCVEQLRQLTERLTAQRAHADSERARKLREHDVQLEEKKAAIAELEEKIREKKLSLEAEKKATQEETRVWSQENEELLARRAAAEDRLRRRLEENAAARQEMEFWQDQDKQWRAQLSILKELAVEKRAQADQILEEVIQKRGAVVRKNMQRLNDTLMEIQKRQDQQQQVEVVQEEEK